MIRERILATIVSDLCTVSNIKFSICWQYKYSSYSHHSVLGICIYTSGIQPIT